MKYYMRDEYQREHRYNVFRAEASNSARYYGWNIADQTWDIFGGHPARVGLTPFNSTEITYLQAMQHIATAVWAGDR